MQETLNLKVKYRESFRPFAPSVFSKLVRLEFRGLIHADGCAGSAAARAAYEALISPRGVVQVEC